jgi:hypothetical protein
VPGRAGIEVPGAVGMLGPQPAEGPAFASPSGVGSFFPLPVATCAAEQAAL